MARKQVEWTRADVGDEVRFVVPPSGVAGYYKQGLWLAAFATPMTLALGTTGVYGGIAFDDFEFALRILMFVTGLLASIVAIGYPVRLLWRASTRVSRVRVVPGGVLVETGSGTASERQWFSPASEVEVRAPKRDEMARGGLEFSAGDRVLRVGVAYPKATAQSLGAAVRDAIRSRSGDGPQPQEIGPLGPSLGARARRVALDVARPFTHPTPYLLVDVGAIVGSALTLWVFEQVLTWRLAYPFAFGVFVLGLAGRLADATYLRGLQASLRDPAFGLKLGGGACALALAGWFGLAPVLGFGIAALVAVLAIGGGYLALVRRCKRPLPSADRPALDLALALTLVPISIAHESFMFEFVGGRPDFGPLALVFVPTSVLFLYWPVRMHAFVDDPDDRGNVIWYWITVAWLSIQPLLVLVG